MKKFLLIFVSIYAAFIFAIVEAKGDCIFNADCPKGEYCNDGECKKEEKDKKLRYQTIEKKLPCNISSAPACDGYCSASQRCVHIEGGNPPCQCEDIPCNKDAAALCNGVCAEGEHCDKVTNSDGFVVDCACKFNNCSEAIVPACFADCPNGNQCKFFNGECKCRCGDGEPCPNCKICKNGKCVFPTSDRECTSDEDCKNNNEINGQKCINCICGCSLNEHCPNCEYCAIDPNNIYRGECILKDSSECSQNRPCPLDKMCIECKCF